MILETLLSVAAVGSAVIAGTAMMTKEKDKIIQPTITNNINNSINNSFNKRIETTKTSTSSNVKKSHTTQQSTDIDHDKIIDELYARYKLERNEEELNELLEKLNNLK
jgi:hypothetical protein